MTPSLSHKNILFLSVAGVVLLGLLGGAFYLDPTPDQDHNAMDSESSEITLRPVSPSLSAYVSSLWGKRKPQQPIAFTHRKHLEFGMECANCHQFASRGPQAGIPGIQECMMCHAAVATESPEIQKMAKLLDSRKDIAWERVYGFEKHAHVRFEHAPHIRAEVECKTCHGDMSTLTVAEELVEHTMGSCIECHEQNQASLDCLVCHN